MEAAWKVVKGILYSAWSQENVELDDIENRNVDHKESRNCSYKCACGLSAVLIIAFPRWQCSAKFLYVTAHPF